LIYKYICLGSIKLSIHNYIYNYIYIYVLYIFGTTR
jgi:hypothetical protein